MTITTSVIIPALNAADTLGIQLEALASQPIDRAEVILADNGSTDRTAEIAAGFADRLPVRVIDAGDRPGPSAARNIAAAVAAGDVLLFVDADDLVMPGWFVALRDAVQRGPAGGPVLFATLASARQGADAFEGSTWPSRLPRHEGVVPFHGTGNLGLPRALFVEVGGFDERFRCSEDIDLSIRLAKAGHPVSFAPQARMVTTRRESLRAAARQFFEYGRYEPLLRRSHPDAFTSLRRSRRVRRWMKVVLALPRLVSRRGRYAWVTNAACCAGAPSELFRSASEGSARAMRSLFVTHTPIWPVRSGSAIRRALVIQALARHGDVAVVHVPLGPAEPRNADDAPVELTTVPAHARQMDLTSVLVDGLLGRLPTELVGYRWRRFAGAVASELAEQEAELFWLSRPVAFLATRELVEHTRTATVCDLDDLEDRKVLMQSALRDRGPSAVARLKGSYRAGAWRRLQREAIRQCGAAVVCSEIDARRLLPDRVEVVPNCFPDPGTPRPRQPSRPTVLLLGLHSYGPNADGAAWFVEEVLPELRHLVDGVQVRIVGEVAGGRVQRLAGPDVRLDGAVPDTAPVFANASLLAVPVRYGSGSRVKILEAWARAVPVVSTTIGAEGLDASDGSELLVADTPTAFACACARVLHDADLASRIASIGRERYVRAHTPSALATAVDTVVDIALARASVRR